MRPHVIGTFMNYGFFDDEYEMAKNGYSGQDRMSPLQFAVMGGIFVLIIFICILLRRLKKENVFKIYKVLSFVIPVMEIVKIIFSSVADITKGAGFSWGGILPFYTCSMIIYFLPFAAWGKGWMARFSMAYFCTIGLVAGLSNFIYLSAAGFYPIFSYGGLHSVIMHSLIVFVGMSLLITGIYVPNLRSIYEGMVPIVMFGIPVMVINFVIDHFKNHGWVDYMLLMYGNGFPIIGDLAVYMRDHGMHVLFSLLILFIVYPIATALMTFIIMGIRKAVKKIIEKIQNNSGEYAEE